MSQLPCSANPRGLPGERAVGLGYCAPTRGRGRSDLLEQLAQTMKAQWALRDRIYLGNALDDSGLPREVCRTIRESFEGQPLDVFALDEAIEAAQASQAQALREAAGSPVDDWQARVLEANLTAIAQDHAMLYGGRATERFLRHLSLRAGSGALEGQP
jgi:hypothetical protein